MHVDTNTNLNWAEIPTLLLHVEYVHMRKEFSKYFLATSGVSRRDFGYFCTESSGEQDSQFKSFY